jgi:hypothetical protein
MPLYNNTKVAASFKTTGTPKQANENDPNQGNTNCSGIVMNKNELVKQELLTGVIVLWLVFPMTDESIYADLPKATTKQALDTVIRIIKYQEENLALVGNQEWMEVLRGKQDHNHDLHLASNDCVWTGVHSWKGGNRTPDVKLADHWTTSRYSPVGF